MYDIHCPARHNGGIQANIPAGHPHAGHGNDYYYDRLTSRLRALGYNHEEYSAFSQQIAGAAAIADACALQTHPSLTWMAIPGVMRRMHVVEYQHAGSLY
jgi:hypothetical protein